MCDSECKDYRETDYPIPGRWQIGDLKFNRCPKSYVTEDINQWLIAYKMFKNGFLPNIGGWLQQSSKFIEIMAFLETQITVHEKEMADKNGRR